MNKNTIKRILSCIVFAALLFGAILKCCDVLEQKEGRKEYTPFYESKTNFDVIFLGTSHMRDHILPMELWKRTGIASYNWGYSNCTHAESYYLLQEIVNYTSPKLVVLDVYGSTEYEGYGNRKYRTDKIEQQHVQFDTFPIWSKVKMEAARDVFDDYEHNEDFIWNFIMYHNRWTELTKDDFEYELSTEKGARYLTGLGKSEYTKIPDNLTMDVSNSVCYQYLLKIIEFCKSRDISVLCLYIPYAAGEEQQRVANTVADELNQYSNCTYVNMLNMGILDFDTDASPDDSHLNYSGAVKVTDWVGSYIRDNYELDDYGSNQYWQEDYSKYYEFKKNQLLEQTGLAEYLVLSSDEDFSVQAEVYDKKLYDSEIFKKLAENGHIAVDFAANDERNAAIKLRISSASGELIQDVIFKKDKEAENNEFDIHSYVKAEK